MTRASDRRSSEDHQASADGGSTENHRSSRDGREPAEDRRSSPTRRSSGNHRSTQSIGRIIGSVRGNIEGLIGRRVESVNSVERTEDGWRVGVEVLELPRIPDSTSVLGQYEVTVDGDGEVIGFERVRRFYRNQASEGDEW
jgi:Gas vesicle synthesis protein GvpO